MPFLPSQIFSHVGGFFPVRAAFGAALWTAQRPRPGFWVPLVGLLVCGGLSTVHGQASPAPPVGESSPPGPSRKAEAAEAFEAGLSAYQAGDYEQARAQYARSYALFPHQNALYNLALSYERLLDYDQAIAAFERFLAEPLDPQPEMARSQESRRALAARTLTKLRSLPARISITASPEPTHVALYARTPDGQQGALHAERETPGILTVPAGSYRLFLSKPGYEPSTTDLEAHVGQAILVSRQLAPRPRRVVVESQPPARLFIDDRPVGSTPFAGHIPLGSHQIRVERSFYLTQLQPLDLPPGTDVVWRRLALSPSGRIDMIVGGTVAGATLGLMVLRLFMGAEIETLPRQEIHKPLAAMALPAVLGATAAGLAGWRMHVSEAQLLIGGGGFGTCVGFGLGLGAQPQGPLPHVLAVGGSVVGGTLGAVIYRFFRPSSSAVALFHSAALWSTAAGALGWAYLINERPETAFYGHPSAGRAGDGGWVIMGTALGGMGLGLLAAQLPMASRLTRGQVALVDLGAALGGLVGGAVGMAVRYPQTGSWHDTARIAIPTTLAGMAAGLLTTGALLHLLRGPSGTARSSAASQGGGGQRWLRELKPPVASIGSDLGGGLAFEARLISGRF